MRKACVRRRVRHGTRYQSGRVSAAACTVGTLAYALGVPSFRCRQCPCRGLDDAVADSRWRSPRGKWVPVRSVDLSSNRQLSRTISLANL